MVEIDGVDVGGFIATRDGRHQGLEPPTFDSDQTAANFLLTMATSVHRGHQVGAAPVEVIYSPESLHDIELEQRFSMDTLLTAILEDDRTGARELLKADSGLATSLIEEARLYTSQIFHWIYAGDTALHLAAAGYRVEIVEVLLDAGADPSAAGNHRHSGPLHYAADGYINGPAWDAKRQVKTLRCLLDAGADINAQDKNGAAPLHRAVRTRCAAAVKCLLEAGSDPMLRNKTGSTPFHLAVQNTGRGGSGAEQARAAQQKIIGYFLSLGISPALRDGKGNSVLDWAKSGWIQDLLSETLPDPASRSRSVASNGGGRLKRDG